MHWIDVSIFGEGWQVEMTEDQRDWQHKRRDPGDDQYGRDWTPGRPPSGFHSQAAADKRAA